MEPEKVPSGFLFVGGSDQSDKSDRSDRCDLEAGRLRSTERPYFWGICWGFALNLLYLQKYIYAMVLDVILYILVFSLIIAGLVGCFLPVLPGPPLSLAGYLLLLLTPSEGGVTWWSITILTILTAFTIIADFVLPALGVKVFGGTKWGNWGCILGSIVGLFFAPWGIIIGPFVGAFLLEYIYCHQLKTSLLSATGSFVGFVVGSGLKVVVCLVIFLSAIIALFF